MGIYMLNEKKIAAMTKMSIYSKGKNKKDLDICEYFKYDYVTHHILITLLWVALIYCGVAAVVCVLNIEYMLEILIDNELYSFLMKLAAGLGSIWLIFTVVCFFIYKKQYEKAQENTQKYYKELYRLNRLYAKEEE